MVITHRTEINVVKMLRNNEYDVTNLAVKILATDASA